MAIELTESAVDKLLGTIAAQSLPDGTCARLSIKGGGCAGYTYTLDFDGEQKPLDNVFRFERDGSQLTVLVDPKSYLLINGTRIDYINTLMEQRFTFDNPLATGQCGCGTSFAVS
ncbi:MAG: HesB/IscA family protein [Planctomycetota bacterium]